MGEHWLNKWMSENKGWMCRQQRAGGVLGVHQQWEEGRNTGQRGRSHSLEERGKMEHRATEHTEERLGSEVAGSSQQGFWLSVYSQM